LPTEGKTGPEKKKTVGGGKNPEFFWGGSRNGKDVLELRGSDGLGVGKENA